MRPVAVTSRQPRPTFADEASSDGKFFDNIALLLDKIDCRLADSGEQREAIFRLRYEAYLREGAISPRPSRRFSDSYDEIGNVYLFGVYVDGELASSVRIHVASKEHPDCLSLEAFPDYLQPELEAGKVIIDPTRFVTDEHLARVHRGLPYATLRLCGMAARYFGADHILAAVRPEHQAFYRRVFQHQLVCEPRPYPGLVRPLSLMTIHYPTVAEQVHRRYPFFRSTLFERRMLFERHQPSVSRPRRPAEVGAVNGAALVELSASNAAE